MTVDVHPTAIVDARARIGVDVLIGPYCVIGGDVQLHDGVRLASHVAISGHTTVGAHTRIFSFAALGGPPQDFSYKDEPTTLLVGDGCTIREQVTLNLGTARGRGETRIGDKCYFMVGSHVGHDCIVGDSVVFANNATLGGHVIVGDFVNFGGLSAVHQNCRVGKYAFVGGGAPVTGDVIPFGMVDNHGHLHGLNLIGLKRRGFSRDAINRLRALYRGLFFGDGHFEDRVAAATQTYGGREETQLVLDFIEAGQKRALCLPEGGRA